jgi:penicillin-binding protein 2
LEALKYSCNTFFYQLGLKVGPDRISKTAEAFGLGRPTGSGLLGERPGLVPSPAWKKKALRDKWHAGDTVSLAIGQGLITVTPLQVARFMAAVANGGTLWKPRLVTRVKALDGTALLAESTEAQAKADVAPVVFEFLRQALWAVVNDGGTGKGAMLPGLNIAGKTGTAQTREFKDDADRKRRDGDNAWFAAFAPGDDPQVVVVVFAERAGLGGQVAAPIAGEIFKAIFLEKVASAGLPG